MLKYSFLFLLFIYPNFIYSIDSLKIQNKIRQLEVAIDTQKLRLYTELSYELSSHDNEKAKAFAEQGIILAKELGDSLNCNKLYSNLGLVFYCQNEYEESIDFLDKSLRYFQKIEEDELTAKSLFRLGATYGAYGKYQIGDSLLIAACSIYEKSQDNDALVGVIISRGINFYYWKKFDEAKLIYKKGLKICETIEKDKDKINAKILLNLGLVEMAQDNFTEALESYLESDKIEHDDEYLKANIYENLGSLYNKLGDWKEALGYHQKGLLIKRRIGSKKDVIVSLNNIGLVYKNLLNYGEALNCYKEALDIAATMEGSNNGLGALTGNMGIVLLKLHRYEEAEIYFKRYLKIKQEVKDDYGISRAFYHLGETYRQTGQFDQGLDFALKSLDLSKQINLPSITQLATKSVSENYASLGQFEQAYLFTNQHQELKELNYGEENTGKINALEVKYRTKKKEKELDQKKEQIKKLEKLRSRDQLMLWGLAICCTGLAYILAFVFKQKRNILASQKEAESNVKTLTKKNAFLNQRNTEQQVQLNDYLQQLLENSERLQKEKNKEHQEETNGNSIVFNISDLLHTSLESEEGLKQFKYYFSLVHRDFFKTINRAFPALSQNDLNLAALIKLNLSNKEIAQILNISPPSVKSARQRLYRKMDLSDNDALRNYIIQL